MRPEYSHHFPKKLRTTANRIAGHFLPYLIAASCPKIHVSDDEDAILLTDAFAESIIEKSNSKLKIKFEDLPEAEIEFTHLFLHKTQRFSTSDFNWLFFGAHHRIVHEHGLDAQLGLHALGEEKDRFYIGYATGKILDEHVNPERTRFNFTHRQFETITKVVFASAKKRLDQFIKEVRTAQKEIALEVINENPSLGVFKDNIGEFIEKKLPPYLQKPEDIFVEMQRHKLRYRREQKKDAEALRDVPRTNEVTARLETIKENLNKDAIFALAEYVALRKTILVLLEERLGIKIGEELKHADESLIHQLICPLRKSSDDLHIQDTNLWVVDDKLPFYSVFYSDKQFQSFAKSLKSLDRPDIAIFLDEKIGFRRDDNGGPVIFVEFKKPGRNDYDNKSNPIVQVYDYIKLLRDGKVSIVNAKGAHLATMTKDTWFIAYIIADLTPKLIECLQYTPITNNFFGGLGRFGFYPDQNLFVEVVSYQKLLQDAQERNRVFFEKLGIDPAKVR